MATKLIGVTVGANQAHAVLLTANGAGQFVLEDETTMNLQAGDRPAAYAVFHGQFLDYVRQHQVARVCIKGSAVSLRGTKVAHLEAAELRGVVQAAAAATGADVRLMQKAVASRSFGTRKVDEYLRDNAYWTGVGLIGLKKGMREAAFAAICESSD